MRSRDSNDDLVDEACEEFLQLPCGVFFRGAADGPLETSQEVIRRHLLIGRAFHRIQTVFFPRFSRVSTDFCGA